MATTSARRAAPDLDRLFRPRTVAIVGASDDTHSPQGRLFLRTRGRFEALGATVVPVSRSRDSVGGVPAVRSLSEIPGELDVVILFVGDVLGAMREVIDREARFAIAFSGGFAEVGAEGAAKQGELEALLAGVETRLLGPNTTLVLYETLREDLKGPRVGVVAQSGAQGQFLMQGQGLGIPVGPWVATGNEADLEIAHFVSHMAADPGCGAVAVYAEGFRDGRRLLRAAEEAVDHDTPVVMVKVGRTEQGARAAISHTGHLAGSDAVTDAALRQHGVVRVDELDQLLDTSALLARAVRPSAGGVCVYGTSGGSCAHLADLLLAAGVPVPELTPETQRALRQWIPEDLSVRNPVDLGRVVLSPHTPEVLETLAADPGIAAVVMPLTQTRTAQDGPDIVGERLGRDAAAVSARIGKPICVAWTSYAADEPAYAELVASPAHVFRSFRTCVTAVRAYLGWHEHRARRAAEPRLKREPSEHAQRARELIAGGSLSEHDALELLALYGIPVPRRGVARSRAEAVSVAQRLGGRVVAKVLSPTIPHKSDLGLVELALEGPDAAGHAYERLVQRAGAVAADAVVEGVLVAEHVEGGVEVVVGVSDDATFGPVVMAGLGGVLVEVLGDVTFRVPPFGRQEARRMIEELRGAALLRAHRGRPAVDLDALADVLVAIGQLAIDLDGLVHGLDVNPLIVGPSGAVAVDALVDAAAGAPPLSSL